MMNNKVNASEENVRLTKLKSKISDKSLTTEERQELMDEIYKESYKNDPRKSLSLHKSCKIQITAYLVGFVTYLINAIAGIFFKDCSETVLTILMGIMCVVMVVTLIVISKHKIEPNDELSKMNNMKAEQAVSAVEYVAITLAVTVLIIALCIKPITITLTIRPVFDIAAAWLYAHLALRNIFFLRYEGKDIDDEEEK